MKFLFAFILTGMLLILCSTSRTKVNDQDVENDIVQKNFIEKQDYAPTIFFINKNIRLKHIVDYLNLKDIVSFSQTCRILYDEVFGFENIDGAMRTVNRICFVEISPNVAPFLKHMLEQNSKYLTGIKIFHHLQQFKVTSYTINEEGKMLMWDNYDIAETEIITKFKKRSSSCVEYQLQNINCAEVMQMKKNRKIKMIFCNQFAEAILNIDGSVETRGSFNFGGNFDLVKDELRDIEAISTSFSGFTALRKDGKVIQSVSHTVFSSDDYSDFPREEFEQKFIKSICSTDFAHAALTAEGEVILWGSRTFGGDLSFLQDHLKNVKYIFSNSPAFAALREDGEAIIWDRSSSSTLKNVKMIIPSNSRFAIWNEVADIFLWEVGTFNKVNIQMKNIQMILPGYNIFAVLTNDGELIPFGFEEYDTLKEKNKKVNRLKSLNYFSN